MSHPQRRSSALDRIVRVLDRSPRVRRRSFTPTLDSLEFRAMLSTLVVTNANDSGPGSLRQDIAKAASGQTITFSNSLRGQTITLSSGELDITDNITIQGLGAGQLAVSGDGSNRVFQIGGGASVTISGLTITDGLAADGAGIVNLGTLTLDGCVVTNNQANENATNGVGFAGDGGGLENLGGATMAISNCTVSFNESVGDPNFGGITDGGGISNDGIMMISGSNVSHNQALAVPARSLAGKPSAAGFTRSTRSMAPPP